MLNTQQQTFYDKIVSLDFNKILLTGEGGTGKTYTLVKALEELIKSELNVLVCAPTHMARLNLLSNFSPELRERVANKTVAGALKRFGFKTHTGDLAFSSGDGSYLDAYDVIAIDEVSMLSDKELNIFLASKALIIFTGDPKQLPVVKQKKANLGIFASDFEHIHLTEQMRQHSAIYALAVKARELLYIPQRVDMSPEHGLQMVDSVDDLYTTFITNLKASTALSDTGHPDVSNHRYLCYTNDEALDVNQRVRYDIYQETHADYLVGEPIMLSQTSKLGYNSEIVYIEGIEEDQLDGFAGISYYRIFSGGEFVNTFSQSMWKFIKEDLSDKRKKIPELRAENRNDLANQYADEIAYISENFTEICYPYATTVHKAQGQTIENVYLNTISIDNGHNKRALMYVGISRASSNLWVVEVPLKKWQRQRQVNAHYREGKKMYEAEYREGHNKLRDRNPHPCSTLDEKELWGWMHKAHAAIPAASRAIARLALRAERIV
jgi:exodeoxyribonuclease-5